MPKFDGLNTCLPSTRMTNFCAMEMEPANISTAGEEARSKMASDSAVASALSGSKRSRPTARPHSHCVPSVAAMRSAMPMGG